MADPYGAFGLLEFFLIPDGQLLLPGSTLDRTCL